MAPFQPKDRAPDIDAALRDVLERFGRWETAKEWEQDRRGEMIAAIRAAQAKGANLRELAAILHMTPESVRKMVTGKS